MNFLFVMKYRGNAGNTHAVANYMRVAPKFGHRVAIYGTPLWYVSGLQFSTEIHEFDRIVFVYESELYREKWLREVAMFAAFPKNRRMVLDSDGMYNRFIRIDGYDSNHHDEVESDFWVSYLDTVSDKILQPTVGTPKMPGATAMAFYGYDPALEMSAGGKHPKQYDILHVGHNWWRWKEVSGELMPAFEKIRDQVGEIGFVGLWWDKPPLEGLAAGPAQAFQSDPELFKRLRITINSSVMFHDVIRTMSSSKINIMTQRPVLRHLKHLTLKYFEIFYADTIPLVMLDQEHATAIYGRAGRELSLPGRVAEKLLDALRRPDHYREIVQDVRRHLAANYSYDRLVGELTASMQN